MNKSLSAQIVPLLVLVVALLGVSAYVFDLEPKTEVKTSIEGLLPNQTDAEFGGLYLRYPANWIASSDNTGYYFSPKDDPSTTITAVLENTTPEDYLSGSQDLAVENYCASDICGYTWSADAEDQFDLQSYLMPIGDGQSLRFDYQTPPGEDVNQEIIDGMIRTAEVKPFVAQTLDVPPFAQVIIPANWQGNVQPAGASSFQSANLTNGAGNLTLFPVTMEFVPELFSITIPEGDATPEVILQTVLASVPAESFIEPQAPVTIGNHSGSMAVLLNSGNTFEIGVLAVGEEHALVYSMETAPDGFEAFRSNAYDIIRTIQWDVPGVENVAVDTTDEGTTEDTVAADETEGDTSEGDTTSDTSEDGTAEGDTSTDTSETDATPEVTPAPDGTGDTSDEADTTEGDTTSDTSETDATPEDTTEGDTSATEGDTTGETDTTEDTSETGATGEPVQVEVNVVEPLPLGEAFVNEVTGLSVAVPEGFTARGDSNFTYLTQGTDSIRYFVGSAADVATRIGIEAPAEGTPNALLTAYLDAEADGYDEVSDVLEFDNYAYVDATRGSSIRRFAIADLGEGQLVYIEAKATTANFDVFGATTLATIKTLSMGEAPATSSDTEATDATATSEDTSDENTTDGTDTSETGDTDATDSANTDETDTTADTDVVAPELTETASGSIITALQYPAGWEATVGQMGDTPFENAELANDTSFINIIPVPMELTPVLFQMNLPNEDITPEAVLTTLVANMPATTTLVADVTPIEFDNYSGAYIVVSSEGRSVEIGVLQAGDTGYGLVYSADMDDPNFAAVHATIQAVLPTVELDLDALATASGNEPTSDVTEDSTNTTSAEDTTSDEAGESTDDSADTTSAEDATGDEAVESTDDSTDTSGEATTTEESVDTSEETAISEDALPLGDPFTNEELGLTVNVPEGFNPRADSNYLYVDQVSSSVRFAVGPVEEVATRLGLELESYPNQDIAVNLMTLFAAQAEESESYDAVSAVTVNDNGNRAYVDVTRSVTKRRFIVMELEDGRLLYVETKAPTAEFDVMSATTMAMLQSMTVVEPVTE